MTTEARHITVGGIRVEVIRKDIKNLHLGVYPPQGRVRVAAPIVVSDEAVRLAVVEKLGWVKRQIAAFSEQPRQSRREMVNGESHYYLGRRYRLSVREHDGRGHVVVRRTARLELCVRRGTDAAGREQVLLRWYRERLRELVPPLLAKWERKLGVKADAWGIRRMKTKWGACNAKARRIWLNLELAKKPISCTEYIIVHELTHLMQRHHDDRFVQLMDSFLPDWRRRRDQLNTAPLAHESWDY